MDGPAPAILNAIENATGRNFNQIPLMPEDMMEGMAESFLSAFYSIRETKEEP